MKVKLEPIFYNGTKKIRIFFEDQIFSTIKKK